MVESGTLLGNYRILQLLASGGMGEVYVAEDTRLERRIALKVLPADMASDPERLERFGREARVVASLNHPNIVTIHSVEEAPGSDGETLHFITMELVEGRTLDREIPHGGLTLDRFFAIAVPLADAVGAAHQKGITHRDLKPGNVMFTADGRLKVLDFGLAKLAEDNAVNPATDPMAATAATVAAAPITEEGKVLGTVAYMSPEQAEGKPVDNRSDIFSLGIMLYEMVTGALPFSGDTKMSLMSSIIKDTPVSVTEVKRELPNHLGRIIKRCLEKNPERRFQSAQDVRIDLAGLKEEIDSGEVVTTQSSIDVMRAAGVGPAAPAAASDPSLVSGPSMPAGTDPSLTSGPAAAAPPSDPSVSPPATHAAPAATHISSASGEVPAATPAAAAGGLLANKTMLAGIAAVVVVIAAGWWMFGGSGETGSSGTSAGAGTGVGIETIADTRPSVAVLYFDNLSGDESLDWLRTGLTELLVTDLSQSPELRVLTTDALYEILDDSGNLEARTTSAAVVRAVAEQGHVEHVVVGSFIRAGDTFRLSARLQKPSTGETLAAETVEGIGEDSVFASVDSLTRRIKDRLQIPISSSPVVDRDLSDVTTASMDAYRNYTDGVNLISQNRSEDAIPVFERALEIDPEFAMAFAKLSVVYGNMRDFEQERAWAEKAIEHADRLTQRERYYIEGRYYSTRVETLPQAIEAYGNALALYPDDSASGNNIGNAFMTMEQYDRAVDAYEETLRRGTPFLPAYLNAAGAYANAGACDKALELMRDFARSRPEYHYAYYDLAATAVQCDRPDEALAAAAQYRESVAAGSEADVFDGQYEALALILQDDFDRAAEEAERLADSPSPRARFAGYASTLALVAQYRGNQRDAIDILAGAARSAADNADESVLLWTMTAQAQIAGGDPEAALESLDNAAQGAQLLEQDEPIAAWGVIAQARAGRTVAARTAAREHERLSTQLPPPWARRGRLLVEAEVARSQGDTETAADLLQEAIELVPRGNRWPAFADEVRYTFPLAELRLAAGNATAATELFERITELGSQRLYYPYEYVRAFYYLGKIAQDDGNTSAARRNYQRFLEYWGDGDLDPERVAEARAFLGGN